jgi:hypothetical protein
MWAQVSWPVHSTVTPDPRTVRHCAGLGLELWKDDRLRWKSEAPDPEAAGSAGAVPTSVTRPGRSRVVPGPSSSSSSSAAAKVLGVIPLRVWLIVAYLSILHIAVMVSIRRCAQSVVMHCNAVGAMLAGIQGPVKHCLVSLHCPCILHSYAGVIHTAQ